MINPTLKTIAVSVILAQAVTFGSVFAYKATFDRPMPAFALSSEEMQGVVANAIEQGIKDRQRAEVEQLTAGLYKNHENAAESVPDNARVYGDLRGRFTLAEFSDLECGFCKRLHPTLKEIVDRSSGAVNWQWRHLPLGFHNPVAQNAAHASECFAEQKGNKGFWVFIDQWFSKSRMNGGGVDDVSTLAASLGADKKLFTDCMESGKYNELIEKNAKMGEKIGATGTPATVIIDNLTGEKEFVSGAQPTKEFINIMKRMLSDSDAKAAKEQAAAEGRPIDPLAVVQQAATVPGTAPVEAAKAKADAGPAVVQ